MIVSLLNWDTPYIPAIEEITGERITVCRTRAAAMEALPEADIALTLGGAPLLDEDMLNAGRKLKLVLSLSAGIEKLPLHALHERNIAVCNTKGAHAVTIAEFVLGGMLAFSHHFPDFYKNQSMSRWQTFFSGDDLEGQTLLVIGTGNIGREIARKAKAFDMTVVGLRRHAGPEEYFDEIREIGALRAVLPRADFVVVATPLTDETYHLLGAEEFLRMKKSAVLINIARGDTVDEEALIGALRENRLGGAVLDVFHTEPLPEDSPLWTMDNVIVTPHNAGLSYNSERKTIESLSGNILRFRQGLPLVNRIKRGEMY
jgi:phosphoglycerate dehydrogenase-like enzyme